MFRRLLYGTVYTVAGVLHFTREENFRKIVPKVLPCRKFIVQASGVMEVLFGLSLLLRKPGPKTKRLLQLFLVAVFPANVYMAANNIDLNGRKLPWWALWGRLPLQGWLIKEMDKL
ncbi:DoxX family protein [Macrococcus equipercicus]|uniref:DoxX family membrane protein n=1 Tax=Macrococcus equipercicus TaxID=69967 RepID=A0A9Q9BT90_9STAP|nr:hypothetical protein [Macrococcus equipercicus]KAA1039290.1 hypothetical protein ERX35_006880 [Macrococcus equipercicus]UTH13581.1 hypothetical protein KFV11_10205 [Macrococcus equipercicus]